MSVDNSQNTYNSYTFNFCCHKDKKRKRNKLTVGMRFEFLDSAITVEGENIMANMERGQQVRVTILPKDRRGNPANFQQGTELWTLSDPALVTMDIDPSNPLSALFKSALDGPTGSTTITFTADADLDADEQRPVEAVGLLVITTPEVTAVEMQFATPEDQPVITEPETPPTEPVPEG